MLGSGKQDLADVAGEFIVARFLNPRIRKVRVFQVMWLVTLPGPGAAFDMLSCMKTSNACT